MSGKKRKKSGSSAVFIIIMIIAACVFLFSAYKLYGILHAYHETDKEYDAIRNEYTSPYETAEDSSLISGEAASDPAGSDSGVYEDGIPPLSADWDKLKKTNEDIVGWIYVEALPDISYPVCRGEDNDYYLHRTFERQSIFSGAIFEDCHNSPYFDDPNTIIYGHNMKSGAMFGKLKQLKNEETFGKSPYVWILTPEGNYRYRIFAVFDTPYDSDVYTQFTGAGEIVSEWAEKMHKQSVIPTGIELKDDDYYITLSTCTSDSSKRCVAIAKCVSSERPVKHGSGETEETSGDDIEVE